MNDLLTIATFSAGVAAGASQFIAHQAMKNRTYPTPIPRYAVGSCIVFVCFAAALLLDTAQNPITALFYLYAASMAGTWLGYELDHKPASADDLERIASYIEGEHREASGRD